MPARVPKLDLDVLVIGGGAAGLFCALSAGRRGRTVRVVEHANKVGKKILMSGGGRCNFTNLRVGPEHFISANPHFCKSALARYKPEHFIALVKKHGIAFHEKELGQLFCDDSSKQIVQMLLVECATAGVQIDVDCEILEVAQCEGGFTLTTALGEMRARKLVVATGGLSIPSMGASGFGYEVARQYGHGVVPTRAGLVPLTITSGRSVGGALAPTVALPTSGPGALPQTNRATDRSTHIWGNLSGLSLPISAHAGGARFDNAMLITHRGLSGPAILQVSNYWQPGDPLRIDLLPGRDAFEFLLDAQAARPRAELGTVLAEAWPRRFAERFVELLAPPPQPGKAPNLADYSKARLRGIADAMNHWPVTPSGTEGYRTAEVTLGGIDTREVSSSTFESQRVPGLHFIGEVLDVTGWLGGYNFQWAWASAHACAQSL
ncbi:MAG TPA: NAD(P)/FAD-dependent oxidoreductase [Verrucomicrobiae bacterium]|nr:NAD(P)/FAD-dependent oxidoreductase [Verrucomicrobiae bacterium]